MTEQKSLVRQSKLKRIILLIVLGLEGAGGILGGILLAIAPDGRLMKMPVDMMHGTFADFLIPGLILLCMGILTSVAFVEVLKRGSDDWLIANIALVGYVIWFSVEIAILRELHWLHIVWGTPVLVGLWAAFPLIPRSNNSA